VLVSKQNDEAKRRRSTKPTILGKAKVMSYEDVEIAKVNPAIAQSGLVHAKCRPAICLVLSFCLVFALWFPTANSLGILGLINEESAKKQ
jgi:hypothetical protein